MATDDVPGQQPLYDGLERLPKMIGIVPGDGKRMRRFATQTDCEKRAKRAASNKTHTCPNCGHEFVDKPNC